MYQLKERRVSSILDYEDSERTCATTRLRQLTMLRPSLQAFRRCSHGLTAKLKSATSYILIVAYEAGGRLLFFNFLAKSTFR
jgi:hypothetical protein